MSGAIMGQELADLFGNVIEPLTREEEYDEYMHSRQWRNKARVALAASGEKCKRCGCSKYTRKLEVHHLTYERFKNELPEDLEVLCTRCHEKADVERGYDEFQRRVIVPKFYRRLAQGKYSGFALRKPSCQKEDQDGK
jgi:hypothetical protein